MSNTLKNAVAPTPVKVVAVADVVRHGDKILIPDGMKYEDAIALIKSRAEYDGKTMAVSADFEVFPWDGAYALNSVLEEKYGWAQAIATPGFFGDKPPQLISIDVSPTQQVMVPWGRFSLPNIDGYLSTSVGSKDGRAIFKITGEIKRFHREQIENLFAAVRAEIKAKSLYRGKALKIRFTDDDGDALDMPSVRFIDTTGISENMAIYPDAVQQAIVTNLFTPIKRANDCLKNGIPLKRGVMFIGTYGVGKTLASSIASKLAVDNGITFLHVPRADELAEAIKFARQYQSPACVVFCEDIDRETAGERTTEMDDILNIIDGIDSKTQNIIVVLTSNDVDSINPAMLRPGRLDAVIEIVPPDAKAVDRLIRLYAGDSLAANADLSEAGRMLAGNIPATIAEVVKRAKLAQLALQDSDTFVEQLSGEAIVNAAQTMQSQVDLMKRLMAPAEPKPALEEAMQKLVLNVLRDFQEE